MKGLLIFILAFLVATGILFLVLCQAQADNHFIPLLDWEKVGIIDQGETKILVLKNPYPAEITFVVIFFTAKGIPQYVLVGENGLQRFAFTCNDYTEYPYREDDKEAEKVWFLLREIGIYPL